MFKKLLFCLLILVLIVFSPVKVFAYHPDTTHAALTDEIVDFYNYLHPDNQISNEEKEWIVQGSINEDYTVRAINHLYDPVRKISWNEEHFGNQAIAQIAQSAAVAPEKQTTAIDWVNNRFLQSRYEPYGGDRTWAAAIEYWADGNKKEAYITLGHALHLLEDMSVPDHTRNDAHPSVIGKDFGSPYEDYTRRWNRNNISGERFLEKLKRENTKPPQLNSIEEYLESMAQYSNRYFFSKDTINEPYYSLKVDESSCGVDFCYGTDEKGDKFPLVMVDFIKTESNNKIIRTYSIKDKKEYHPILSAYFSRLAPKAILYGAGVMELFQRKAAEQVEFSEILSLQKGIIQVEKGSFVDKLLRKVGSAFSPGGEISKLKNTFVGLINTVADLPKIFSRPSEPEIIDLTKGLRGQILEEQDVPGQVANVESEINPVDLRNQQDDEFDRLSEFALEENKSGRTDKTDRTDKTNETDRTNTVLAVSSGGGGGGSSNNSAAAPQFFPVIINEIMYDLPAGDEGREWIEIFNNSTTTVDLSSWKFFENDTNHALTIVQGSFSLPPNGYAVIAADTTKFLASTTYTGTLFDSSFSLSNSGEAIAIKNDTLIIDEVVYSPSIGANGDGSSLQLINGSWQAAEPTPGERNEITPIAPLGPVNPIASFSHLPTSPQTSEMILFNAASSTVASGTIISYEWDFGDLQTTTVSQATTTHSYSAAGSYVVGLKVITSDNTSSTATSSIIVSAVPVAATSTDHVVISEFVYNAEGSDVGNEFIELYNPTASDLGLNGWSLKLTASNSTSSDSLASFGGKPDDVTLIKAKSFLLVGLNGNTKGGINRSASLPQADGVTYTIILFDASDKIVDEINYNSTLGAEKSLERKAWESGNCISAQGSGEFLGNGCDTDSIGDFEVRAVPTPQNSQSLPEPREAPTAIANFTVGYHFSIPTLTMSWSFSTDYSGSTSTIHYEIEEMNTPTGSTAFSFNSTSNALEQTIDEIGRNYEFSIKAVDSDGLASISTVASTTVPGFVDNIYFYKDPRTTSTAYLVEIYYQNYPFIPQIYSSGNAWRMIAFYLNKDAEKIAVISDPRANYHLDGMIQFVYKRCNGSVENYLSGGYVVILPDTINQCESTGPKNSDLSFNLLEDNHFLLAVSGPTNDLVFSSSTDYITVAYYDGTNSFQLVAVDKTKHYFQNSAPAHQTPTAPSNLAVESYTISSPSSTVQISWYPSSDSDSLDDFGISYELSSNNSDWRLITLVPGSDSSKLYTNIQLDLGNTYDISLRAVDDFNTTSTAATTTVILPAPIIDLTPDSSNPYFAVDDAKIENGLLKIKWRLISNPISDGSFGIIPYLSEAGSPANVTGFKALHRSFEGSVYSETTATSKSNCNVSMTLLSNYTLGWQYETHFSTVSGQAASDTMIGKELQFNLYTHASCGINTSAPPVFTGLPIVISN
ncbi:MAG TPA: lamin tail domain-containing protein [Candidatus Paceibacterota bacterium]|nr:lamin tail domain-containing protein [Candidatus Paceibacterota bacterium]